jgi:hypothetical protein
VSRELALLFPRPDMKGCLGEAENVGIHVVQRFANDDFGQTEFSFHNESLEIFTSINQYISK